jgi:hypothetical protein
MTVSGLREEQIDKLLLERAGVDGEWNTEDDGYSSVAQALQLAGISGDAAGLFSVGDRSTVRIVSIGEVDGIRAGIWAVYEFSGQSLNLLSFREEEIP